MAPNPITPAPEPATITGRDLHERFGDRWDIRRELAIGILTAERRSPDGLHIRYLCARTPAELAAKIEQAEAEAGTGTQAREPLDGGRFQRLQALEDAIKFRRARAAEPCPDCDATADGRCDDHARDLDLIGEYEAAARRLGAGQDCQQPAGARS